MHDNEIIELLEDCCDGRVVITTIYNDLEYDITLQDIYDLINRQKAEIERLQKTQSDIDNFARELCKERMLKGKAIADFEDLQEYIRKEKSEAIREFAKNLKDEAFNCDVSFGFGKEHYTEAVAVFDIEKLVEEMTEGENG